MSQRYEWLSLDTISDLVRLDELVPRAYNPSEVAGKLADGLSAAVKSVLIEHGYIDKDYRSTYYNYYSKKGQVYRTDCVRLHFFDGDVSFDASKQKLVTAAGKLEHHYFGYMVLRPTGIATIGRTVLSPDIRKGAGGFIIAATHKVHLLGYKLLVEGFPWMAQHNDISVCAHVACWAILRHYSEKFSVYREYFTHDITLMAHDHNPGGLVPSNGLHVGHAERVFQQAGTFPVLVTKDADLEKFYGQLHAYVQSGFPLFAAMNNLGHAVAVVGYKWRTVASEPTGNLRSAWDQVSTLSIVDDNHLPYISIPATMKPSIEPKDEAVASTAPEAISTPDESDGSATTDAPAEPVLPPHATSKGYYTAGDITAFIVALPEKVFYPAEAVIRYLKSLKYLAKVLEMPPWEDLIVRYFVTTGSALRSFVRERESEFDAELIRAIMDFPFAQFLWVVEFATEEQWAAGKIEARALVDATASPREILPIWLLHSRKGALICDRREVGAEFDRMEQIKVAVNHTGYSRMEQNLRPTHEK